MTTQEFVEWVKATYETKTLKAAMMKAANFLGVSEHTIKTRMKKTISENVALAMTRIVENPPPPNYVSSEPAEYVISIHIIKKSDRYNEYKKRSSQERKKRHDLIMNFFDAVMTAYDCRSLKEAARLSASLLEENFNTVYYCTGQRAYPPLLKKSLIGQRKFFSASQQTSHHGKAYWKTFCNG